LLLQFLYHIPKNDAFAGRTAIAEKIQEMLVPTSTYYRRVSLYGLGGIGYVALTVIQFLLTNCRKTQVALECAYRLRESHPDLSVFWVHASNAERFLQSYMALAFQCEISGRDNPKEILPIVKNWLENKDHGRWLMVIDNADDMQMFFPRGCGWS
jgi:hypothetical protein